MVTWSVGKSPKDRVILRFSEDGFDGFFQGKLPSKSFTVSPVSGKTSRIGLLTMTWLPFGLISVRWCLVKSQGAEGIQNCFITFSDLELLLPGFHKHISQKFYTRSNSQASIVHWSLSRGRLHLAHPRLVAPSQGAASTKTRSSGWNCTKAEAGVEWQGPTRWAPSLVINGIVQKGALQTILKLAENKLVTWELTIPGTLWWPLFCLKFGPCFGGQTTPKIEDNSRFQVLTGVVLSHL